jgi:predicted CopG family antitoxin
VHDPCMAVKTITLDIEAYETLRRLKREGQSFSQVVKERLGSRSTARDLLEAVRGTRLSEDALEAIERQVTERRRSAARSPRF